MVNYLILLLAARVLLPYRLYSYVVAQPSGTYANQSSLLRLQIIIQRYGQISSLSAKSLLNTTKNKMNFYRTWTCWQRMSRVIISNVVRIRFWLLLFLGWVWPEPAEFVSKEFFDFAEVFNAVCVSVSYNSYYLFFLIFFFLSIFINLKWLILQFIQQS